MAWTYVVQTTGFFVLTLITHSRAATGILLYCASLLLAIVHDPRYVTSRPEVLTNCKNIPN